MPENNNHPPYLIPNEVELPINMNRGSLTVPDPILSEILHELKELRKEVSGMKQREKWLPDNELTRRILEELDENGK